jgi:6-phosphofructokinase
MKRIAVITSGGDVPGLNAAIRAVTRTALAYGAQVLGVRRGYEGLIEGDFIELTSRSVAGILRQGGTMLGTSRSERFMTDAGRRQAKAQLERAGVEGLVVIGGNGTLAGAYELFKLGVPLVGVPKTIDNDQYGTDIAIGVDTALNTIAEAVGRIKDTASSHRRAFLVEVMGRHCGYLALASGIITGAEMVLIPNSRRTPAMSLPASSRPITSAKRTASSSWPKAGSPACAPCRSTSPITTPTRDLTSARSCWATCSAAAHPPPSTGCWPRGWACAPSSRCSTAAASAKW